MELLDDALADPYLLEGKQPSDIDSLITQALASGWKLEALAKGAHRGQGLMLRQTRENKLTARLIQWHPGGGHHGPDPYWKVSSPERGIIRVRN